MPTATVASTFISAVKGVYNEYSDEPQRWSRIAELLREWLADPQLKARAAEWPASAQGGPGRRAENLLFYEDPDLGFVINGLIKSPFSRTQIHDHAHLWTAYGVLEGSESIERYDRVDDGSQPGHAEIRLAQGFEVGPGTVDLVPPWQIHAEANAEQRTVAVIVRSARPGDFLQNRFDPDTNTTWQGYGPEQIPYDLK